MTPQGQAQSMLLARGDHRCDVGRGLAKRSCINWGTGVLAPLTCGSATLTLTAALSLPTAARPVDRRPVVRRASCPHPTSAARAAAIPDRTGGREAFTKAEWLAIRSACG